MKSRAAVAIEAGKPLEITEIDVQGPKQGEVLVRMVATGVCHTDAFTLSGEDPEGISLQSWAMKVVVWLKKSGPVSPASNPGTTSYRCIHRNAANAASALREKQTFARKSV